ncbi:hypothetical protein CJU89_4966 [Yarrowia sp. B02]|nr:hypothetical protein CJU89_4966 [Yarrowia sp. B02]
MSDFTQKVDKKFGELLIEKYFPAEPFVYSSNLFNTITDTRKLFPDRKNMFDRLFEHNINANSLPQAQKLFPPSNINDLLKLVRLIETDKPTETLQDDLQVECLIYYLLLDANKEAADSYAAVVLIPAGYTHFMNGCHALDRGDMQRAVDEITYPGSVSTFPDAVVQALNAEAVAQKKRREGDELIVRYFDDNTPKCEAPESTNILIASLARLDPMAALTYIRALTSTAHKLAFECLVKACIEERYLGGVWRLGNLPFTKEEGELLHYALDNVSQDQDLNNDILVTRALHLGNVREAKSLINVAMEQRGGEEKWGEYEATLALY